MNVIKKNYNNKKFSYILLYLTFISISRIYIYIYIRNPGAYFLRTYLYAYIRVLRIYAYVILKKINTRIFFIKKISDFIKKISDFIKKISDFWTHEN